MPLPLRAPSPSPFLHIPLPAGIAFPIGTALPLFPRRGASCVSGLDGGVRRLLLGEGVALRAETATLAQVSRSHFAIVLFRILA